jgi:predicted phage terminase large subunit-like protein
LQPGGSIVLVQTRWGTTDFVAWLLSETAHEGWEVISLPAIALDKDPLGRQPGEALWPEAYPLEVLEQIKQTLGSRDWNALYQQCPLSDADVIFQHKWLQFYDTPPDISISAVSQQQPRYQGLNLLQTPKTRIIHSWDLTFGGTGAGSSWVVGQVWLIEAKNKYLLHMLREQMGFSATLAAIRALELEYPAIKILVENKAAGPFVIETLKEEIGHKLVPVEPGNSSKSDRAYAVVPQFERGEVWLPSPNIYPWVKPMLREMESFPQSPTDDCVDAMTQLLRWDDNRFRARERNVEMMSQSRTASFRDLGTGHLLWDGASSESPYEAWKRRNPYF